MQPNLVPLRMAKEQKEQNSDLHFHLSGKSSFRKLALMLIEQKEV